MTEMGGEKSNFSINPALNPTREWRDDPEVVLELSLLIKKKSKTQHEALAELAKTGRYEPSTGDLPEILALNKWAEAFGYVALVQENDGIVTITDTARDALRRALAELGH
ncbi:hypothetical protein GCM10027258_94890 [Amycolatopsis stemonae]